MKSKIILKKISVEGEKESCPTPQEKNLVGAERSGHAPTRLLHGATEARKPQPCLESTIQCESPTSRGRRSTNRGALAQEGYHMREAREPSEETAALTKVGTTA